jgi:hypothetical protein
MKKSKIHVLTIFIIALLSFLALNIHTNYNTNIKNFDFWWGQSIHYGYSSIFKQYFLDFFNSFYLYNVELGYDHSYYFFSHLNPFYSFSILGLEDYSIRLSNLFAFLSATFFLLKISKILNYSWIKTYLLVLFPLTFISLYGYASHSPMFNANMFVLLYILFFFDLKNRSVNYIFYIFYFIFASLTSAFTLIFYIGIVFLIVSFFYKFKKEHKSDLIFFLTSNIIIWSIAIGPFIIATQDLSNIYIVNILKILFLTFVILFIYLFKFRLLKLTKKIKIKFFKNIILQKVFFGLIILLFFYLIYLVLNDILVNFNESKYIVYLNNIFDLFRHNRSFNIISTLEKLGQFDLINEIRIGSGIFMYIPIGLLIFTIINYRTKTKNIEIIFISIVSLVISTLLLNSQFIYNFLGVRLFRFHINFIPIILMLFIYFNLFINLDNSKKNYFFDNNNFNRDLLLFPALILDFFLINSKSAFPYLFILFLYFPFLIIFFKNNKKFKEVSFLIILVFVIIQPLMNIGFYKYQYKSVTEHDLEQYNTFINCFKTKSNYDEYDRVLATGTGEKERNYISIMTMLLERERGTDINILYQYREIVHPKLYKTYNDLLDYKFFGKNKFPPIFYNTKKSKYYFEESFFDHLGVNSVIVFNDNDYKFSSKYKSFLHQGSCQTKLYKADIYKSKKPRGSVLFLKNDGKAIKLENITKNTWDISSVNNFEGGSFIFRFTNYSNTKIFVDNTKVDFEVIKGKIIVPHKSGQILKIIYNNDYHRLFFILTIIEYLIIVTILVLFLFKRIKSKFNISINKHKYR